MQADPKASILYGVSGIKQQVEEKETAELTIRKVCTLAAFLIGFVIVVYGATHGWSTSDQIPVVLC